MKKKEVNEMLYTGMMPPVKPTIEKAILNFVCEYDNSIESYSLDKDSREINLRITLTPKDIESMIPGVVPK